MEKRPATLLSNMISTMWQQLPDAPADWLKTALHKLATARRECVVDDHLKYSAMAKRKVGETPLIGAAGNADWSVDEVARLALLVKLLAVCPPTDAVERIKAAFKFGDENEQIAIIKGLSLIDANGELSDLAISTGRTNSLNLFGAIALNNDYANQHYDKRAYHQLVLKALFMDLDIGQMVGLKQHLCPELSALAIDLANERLAASRQPPGAIWLAIDVEHLNLGDQVTYRRFTG
jgi:hypothetical protein